MRISDWSSDVCSSDLGVSSNRSYSVANRPGSCELIFHVKAYEHGEVSQYLKQGRLREGDMFELVGPHGTFGLGSQAEAPAVMVAGGTGLAPLCALLEEEFASGRKRQRSEEHTSELQSLMRLSYAVFCLTQQKHT